MGMIREAVQMLSTSRVLQTQTVKKGVLSRLILLCVDASTAGGLMKKYPHLIGYRG
jgi:hypothetical protein